MIAENFKFFVFASNPDDEEVKREVEFDWRLIELKTLSLEIQILFKDPLSVSQGQSRDRLIVKIDLSEYDSTVRAPELLETKIPRQIPINTGT